MKEVWNSSGMLLPTIYHSNMVADVDATVVETVAAATTMSTRGVVAVEVAIKMLPSC